MGYLDVLLHLFLLRLQVLAALLLFLYPGFKVMANLFQLLLLGGQARPELLSLGTQLCFCLELLLQLQLLRHELQRARGKCELLATSSSRPKADIL